MTGTAHQTAQQAEFRTREAVFFAIVGFQALAILIQFVASGFYHGMNAPFASTHNGVKPGDQLLSLERFCQVIVCSRFQSFYFVVPVAPCRKD